MGNYKSRNNSIDGLERNWPEEKQLIDEKSRNNRWTGAERSSEKTGGKNNNGKQTRKIHMELDSASDSI